MKRRIHGKFLIVSAAAIIITAFFGMLLFYNILKGQIFDDMKADSKIVSLLLKDVMEEKEAESLKEQGLRITVAKKDGTVIYDSVENIAVLENHSDRQEIKQALKVGEGRAMRKSQTSSKHTFYYAVLLDEGVVLRISKDSDSIHDLMVRMGMLIIIVAIVVFWLCMILSRRLARHLVEPIEKMADNIMLMDDGVYDELRPFVATIKKQHMDILEHAKLRQEFTANVSHELKTPLTAISGYAELIESGITPEKDTRHFAGQIHRSAERLQNLINDIIKLSELDDDEQILEKEMVDLHEIAKDCAATMEYTAEKNEVLLFVKGEHILANVNKELLDELVYNLCSNAIRYNKKGGKVIITTKMVNEKPMLSVKDTGIGIPKDQQERVFERFYRVDKSRSKSTGGTGLGLAIVKHIVAQHDAELVLDSKEGVGTEIKVFF